MLLSLTELASELDARIDLGSEGDASRLIADVAPLETAGGAHLAYLESEKHVARLAETRAAAILAPPDILKKVRQHFSGPVLLTADPRHAFIAAMLRFRPLPQREYTGVSREAIVSLSAAIGENTNIHPTAVVGERTIIGRDCDICAGAVIADDCVIGDGTVIHPRAVLYRDVRIGQRVIIHAGAVIGADGFGYEFIGGRFVRIPHTGTVLIGDDVEIGANTTIDRAMVGATVIGEGTKIDNLVMIGHNCEIGRHNAFASQVGFAGSVKTGDYVRCAGQAGMADHLRLGEGCTIGPQAGVHTDIPPKQKCHGSPAIQDKEQIRLVLTMQKLPQMYRDLQAVMQQVEALRKELPPGPAVVSERLNSKAA